MANLRGLELRLEQERRKLENVPIGPLQELEVLGAPIAPGPATGQSLLRLIASPVIDKLQQVGVGALRRRIESDEDFQKFQKDNPTFASGLLRLLDVAPSLLLAQGLGVRGLARPHSDVVSRSPGAENFKRMRREQQSGIGGFIDDLLGLGRKPEPAELPKPRKADPRNPEEILEVLMRR